MSVKQSDYEKLLAECSCNQGAIALLKQYRPYLETLPSTRRPEESLVTIPLPVVTIRQQIVTKKNSSIREFLEKALLLPCDLGIIMCDPEWKIKIGTEIIVFIHRPHEDFSQLLTRWRQTQVYLEQDYKWMMPLGAEHMFSEAADKIYPLFVVFDSTDERIKKGLGGAGLPYVTRESNSPLDQKTSQNTTV